MASFMDYYQEELRKRGGASPASNRPSGVSLSSLRGSAAKDESEGNPIASMGNWIMDMISRPTYGMTNMNRANVDRAVQGQDKIQSGDFLGGVGDILSGLPSMPATLAGPGASIPLEILKNLTGNSSDQKFVEGLTSNDREKKMANAELLEYSVDKLNERNPDYKDVQDNVDAPFKGVAGFALDVAGDPLTFVSGTGLLKGAGAIAKGVDRGLSSASRALVGAKAPARGVEDLAEEAVKAPKPKKARTQDEDFTNPMPDDGILDPGAFRPRESPDLGRTVPLTFTDELARATEVLSSPAPRQAIEAPAAAMRASETASPVDEVLGQAPRATEAPTPPPAAAQTTQPGPALPDEVLDEAGAIPTGGSSIEDLIQQNPNRQPIADILTRLSDDMATGRTRPFDAREFITTNTTKIYHQLPGDQLQKSYRLRELANIATVSKGTPRGDAARNLVVDAIDTEKRLRQGQAATPMDALGAFQQAARMEESSMRAAFGDELFDYLHTVNSSKKLHSSLVSIKNVIDADEGVTDILRNMDQNLSRLLAQRLGIPRAAKPKTPEEVAALADRLLSNNEPYQAALAKGLANALDAELKDLSEKGYLYYLKKMGMKVARTSKKSGEGKGRYVDQLNGFSQYTMLRKQKEAIEIAARDIMRARGVKGDSFTDTLGPQRTGIYKEAALRVMEDQARLLDDIGAHMSIGVGADTTMLSMSEVYRSLLASADELGIPRTIDQGLFNYGTQAAPTAITDAAARALQGGSREEILEILTDPKKYGNKGLLEGRNGRRANNLIDWGRGWGFVGRTRQEATAKARALLDELDVPNADRKNMIRVKEAGQTSKRTGQVRKGYHAWVSYKTGNKNYMAEALADTIMRSADDLKIRAAENEAAFVARTRQEIHKLSSDELQKIESFLKDPSGAILKIRAFAARKKRIEAEAAAMNASVDAANAAEDVVDAALGQDLVSTLSAADRAQTQATSASTAIELREATDTFTGGVWSSVADDFSARPTQDDLVDPLTGLRPNEEWAEVVDETTPLAGDWTDMLFDEAAEFIRKDSGKKKPKKGRKGAFVDLSEDAPAMVDAFGQRIIDPYGIMKHKVRLWFDQNYLADNAMRVAHSWQNSMSMRTAYMGHQLNAIHKAARKIAGGSDEAKSMLASTFAAIQRGDVYGGTDEAVKGLDEMIRGVLGDFFDLDASGSMGNVFLRTTSQPELINNMLKQKGIDEVFDLDLAQRTAASQGIPLDQALSDQWKSWKVTDPLDFISRMSQVRQELAFNKGTALSFVEMAKSKGAVSKKKAPGFVRIQASGESRFAAHLPRDIYVKRELAEELRRVEQVYRTSREFQGELKGFVQNVYGPLLNAWKFGITLPRPGHHIRNLIGDTSVTWMRRGNMHFGRSWKDAVKLLATRNNYADVNMLEAATRYGISDLPKGGDVIVKTGKYEFTSDELYAALAEGGALPTYNIGEDFVESTGRLDQVLGKVTLRDTAVGEQLGKLSEGRDHLARFQHFIQAIRQDGKHWKGSREDLLDTAIREVIKYHPDSSLLTTVESKIRLAIPFYSWFGKIIPALVESMVMHPGRLSTFNKASYNIAVANGLDPETLSDPFPDDQLFPGFLTESTIGPQFTADMLPIPGGEQQYIRLNPGIAHLDVMDSLGADPLRGLAGMTSPLIRVPAELLSGGSWSTGGRINDWSDYIDQTLPGVNYVANISGVSPTGSVESLLSGRGLDPQAQVARGNKTDFDKYLSVANWLTGLGIQNLSRPNYINYAEIERRNEAGSK